MRASLQPLLHPLWIASLGLLVLNDHLLKRAGLLPGWLTGKLSDFAGMVVAPVLLVALLRLRGRAARFGALAAVAGVFGAINLSPAAAGAFERLCAMLGIPFTTVVDPTDLISFAMLPLAWRILHSPAASSPSRALSRYAQPVLAVAAAVACVATSAVPGPPSWNTSGFLVNNTGRAATVRIRLYDGQIQCSALEADPARLLAEDAFSQGVTFELDNRETLPLQYTALQQATGFQAGVQTPPPQSTCQVVLIQSDGLPDTVAWWHDNDIFNRGVPLVLDDELTDELLDDLSAGQIDLWRTKGGERRLKSHGKVQLTEVPDQIAPSDCDTTGAPLQWSSVEGLRGFDWTLVSHEPLADGCVAMSLVPVEPSPEQPEAVEHFFVCMPADAFVFEVNDVLRFTTPYIGDVYALQITNETLDEVLLLPRQTDAEALGLQDSTLTAMECNGIRAACGSLSVPASLTTTQDGDTLPGEQTSLLPVGVRSRTLFVAHAEQVLAAPSACSSEDTQPADPLGAAGALELTVDLVLLYRAKETQ